MRTFDRAFTTQLRKLAIPIILQSLLSTAIGTADTLMLGAVGQAELSAVSLANQWTFILTLLFTGFVGGTGILMAQYLGSGDKEKVNHVFGMSVTTAGVICVLFCAAAVLAPGVIMHVMTNDAVLVEKGVGYLRIVGLSYLFMLFTQPYLITLKTMQHPTKSMLFSTTSLIVNLILNAVWIYGLFGAPKLGVTGVALATLISRAAELALCALDLALRRYVRIVLRTAKALWKSFFHVSLPMTIQGLLFGAGMSAMASIMGHMGSDVVAANSVAASIQSIARVASIGFADAGAILLGGDLGRKDFDTAKTHASQLLTIAIIAGMAGCILMLLSIWPVLSVMNLTEAAKRYLLVMYIILSVNVIFAAITYCMLCGVFIAGGDTKFGMFLDGITLWSLIALGFLAMKIGAAPLIIYLILKIDEMVKTPIVLHRYRKEIWVRNITEEE